MILKVKIYCHDFKHFITHDLCNNWVDYNLTLFPGDIIIILSAVFYFPDRSIKKRPASLISRPIRDRSIDWSWPVQTPCTSNCL